MSKDESYIFSSGHKISFNGRFKDFVFSPNLQKFKVNPNTPEEWGSTVKDLMDPLTDYKLNNYGYRGPDFFEGKELLVAGCSQTYGIGVPLEMTWGNVLSKKLNVSYSNLSIPGASIEWIVNSVFRYFHDFGNTKYLAIFLPDFMRGEALIDGYLVGTRDNQFHEWLHNGLDDDLTKGIINHSRLTPDPKWKPRITKRPFPVEDITSPESLIYRAVKSLQHLEMYCKAANIKLAISTWADDVAWYITETSLASDVFFAVNQSNYWTKETGVKTEQDPEGIARYRLDHSDENKDCPANLKEGECTCLVYCHEDIRKKYPLAFDRGVDRFKGDYNNSHMGVHTHIHTAEGFYRKLKEK